MGLLDSFAAGLRNVGYMSPEIGPSLINQDTARSAQQNQMAQLMLAQKIKAAESGASAPFQLGDTTVGPTPQTAAANAALQRAARVEEVTQRILKDPSVQSLLQDPTAKNVKKLEGIFVGAGIPMPAHIKDMVPKTQFAPAGSAIVTDGVVTGNVPDKPLQVQPSPVSKMIAERDALPEGDPRRKLLDTALTHATNPQSQRISVSTGDHSAYTNVQPDGQGGFIGLSKRSGTMEKIPQAANATAPAGLTPDAIESGAARYKLDGTLPPNLGRGNQGYANTVKILNRASEMAKAEGNSAESQRIDQLANRAKTAALGQLEKQATMVGAFEKNANMNADLALQFSEKADRTGVPVFNRWILAGKKELQGDPDVTKFNTSNYTFINEYAKVVSGSMGNSPVSDSARNHANEILSTSQTKEQYKQNIALLKTEMRNRMKGFDEERQSLQGSMKRRASDANTVLKFDEKGNPIP